MVRNHNEMLPLSEKYTLNVFAGKNVDACLIGIVDKIPKLFDKLVGIGQIDGMERLVLILLHAEKDDAAQGIGEGGIRLPNAVGQTA